MRIVMNATECLTTPFHELINQKDFETKRNVCHIIRGMMGQGKTYVTATDYLPTLFSDEFGVKFAIYSVPNNEIMDIDLFMSTLVEHGVVVTDSIDTAIRFSRKGKKVLLCTSHMMFTVMEKGRKLLNYLKSSNILFSIFLDEAHTWLVSHFLNYHNVMGATSPKYKARAFTLLEELSNYSPYIFGITATPNREHNGITKPLGNMKFEVINEFPSKEAMVSRSAWYRNIDQFNIKDEKQIKRMVRSFLYKIYNDEIQSGSKKVVLIQTGRSNHREGYTFDHVMSIVHDIIKEDGLWDVDDKLFAVMTGDKRKIMSPNGNHIDKFNGVSGTEADASIKEALNDFNHPSRFCFVVDKGKVGMNIFNLGGFISFRDYDKKNDVKEAVIEMAVQILGRPVRINVGSDIDSFKDTFNYDLEEYVRSLDHSEIDKLFVTNTFDVLVPNISMWDEALNQIKSIYASSVSEAKKWMMSMNLHVLEDENCELCGALPEHQRIKKLSYDELDDVSLKSFVEKNLEMKEII